VAEILSGSLFYISSRKVKKESLSHFVKKLKDKNQTEQQQKQAFHAVSIFYGIKNTDQDEIGVLKNKKENISTKKTGIKSNGIDRRNALLYFLSVIALHHKDIPTSKRPLKELLAVLKSQSALPRIPFALCINSYRV